MAELTHESLGKTDCPSRLAPLGRFSYQCVFGRNCENSRNCNSPDGLKVQEYNHVETRQIYTWPPISCL